MKARIYKYLNFENTIKTLSNNSVLLNNPSDYNDPFDCLIKPSEEEKEECYKRIVSYYVFKAFAEIISSNRIRTSLGLLFVRWELKLFKKMLKKRPYYDRMPFFDGLMNMALNKYCKNNPEFKKELEKGKIEFSKKIKSAIEEISESLLVSCFSKTNKSILMWSHYGDKHRGACIEFEIDSDDFKKVLYKKKRQRLDLKTITAVVLGYDFIGEQIDINNKGVLRALSKLFLTKSRDWVYESEIRVVFSTNENKKEIFFLDEKYFLKMPQIKKVYFGCRADIQKINALQESYPDVEMVLMKDLDKEYKVVEKHGI